MLALKRLPEKHTLIKLAAQTNKRTQIIIQTGRGKRQGGTNNDMCSAIASGDTVINKYLHYVQSGLKYNNLCGKCPERIHYNTLHYKHTHTHTHTHT